MKSDYKYRQVYAALRDKIRRGEYAPGARIPSQRAMMADYGVSYATITSALQTLVREDLIVRHRGAGTFVTDPAAVDGRSGGRRGAQIALGLLIKHVSPHPAGTLKGVCEQAHDAGRKLEFVIYNGPDELRKRCREILDGKIKVDGCLIVNLPESEDVVAAFMENDFPYVIIESPCVYEGMNQILVDHRKGAEIAVGHLIRHGHERIAYLGPVITDEKGETNCWHQSKLEGYRDALKSAGLAIDPDLMVEMPSYSYENACRGTKTLLDRGGFSAIFVSVGGSFSIAAIDVLRAEGKRVPLDVAIISFSADEHTDMADEKYSVSGMCAPREKAGRAAVRALVRLVEGKTLRGVPYLEEIPMTLLGRRSCGCALPFSSHEG